MVLFATQSTTSLNNAVGVSGNWVSILKKKEKKRLHSCDPGPSAHKEQLTIYQPQSEINIFQCLNLHFYLTPISSRGGSGRRHGQWKLAGFNLALSAYCHLTLYWNPGGEASIFWGC